MRVQINADYCKGCGLCNIVCPRGVFRQSPQISERGYCLPFVAFPEKCANWKRRDRNKAVCEMCVLTCPDHALEWEEGDTNETP
ncbi:MAG: ferredoxin family protein [Methanomassiliicoccales archaeon]